MGWRRVETSAICLASLEKDRRSGTPPAAKGVATVAQEGTTYNVGGWPLPRTPAEAGLQPPGGRG